MLDPWPAESTGAALKILGTVAMEDNYKVMHGFFLILIFYFFNAWIFDAPNCGVVQRSAA